MLNLGRRIHWIVQFAIIQKYLAYSSVVMLLVNRAQNWSLINLGEPVTCARLVLAMSPLSFYEKLDHNGNQENCVEHVTSLKCISYIILIYIVIVCGMLYVFSSTFTPLLQKDTIGTFFRKLLL